jgi:hypothetical protein
MKNIEYIRELLDKYLEGLSSLEEEKILREYFMRDDVPKQLKSEAQWFNNASKQKVLEEDVYSLEKVMSQWVDQQEKNENKLRIRFWALGIAAGLALLIGATFIFHQYRSAKTADTYDDPQIAYLETKKVLLYVSQTLNKGTDKLQTVSRIEEGSNEMSIFSTFGSGLKNLELISKYSEESNEKQ